MDSGLKILLFKTTLFFIPVLIVFEVLFRLGYYPLFTDSVSFDSKELLLMKHPITKVKLLGIGSSQALNDLNSQVIVDSLKIPYYNFSAWGLQISDIDMMLRKLVQSYHPRYVLLCSSFTDFRFKSDDAYRRYENTGSFIKDHFPEFFYIENYNSIYQLYLRKVDADKTRNGIDKGYSLNFDRWGGVVLKVKPQFINPDEWNGHYRFPTEYTEMQYRNLDTLAAFLRKNQIKLFFVQSPIKAAYANTNTLKQAIYSHFDRCRSIVQNQGGIYLNYYDTRIFTDSLFIDQYHLQGTGAVVLTKRIVKDLKYDVH